MLLSLALLTAGASAAQFTQMKVLSNYATKLAYMELREKHGFSFPQSDLENALLDARNDELTAITCGGNTNTYLFNDQEIAWQFMKFDVVVEGRNSIHDRLAGCNSCIRPGRQFWETYGIKNQRRCVYCKQEGNDVYFVLYNESLQGKGMHGNVCATGGGNPLIVGGGLFGPGNLLFNGRAVDTEETSPKVASFLSSSNVLAIGAILASVSVVVALVLRRGKYAAVGDEDQTITL